MKKIFLGVILGVLLVWAGFWGVKYTGTANFCSTCHVMDFAVTSYQSDPHSGKNRSGIQAQCVSCHLPHDNIANYLLTKAKNGIRELAITATNTKTNWLEKREHRDSFVYDSGCVSCHLNLNSSSQKAKQMHEHYTSLKGSKNELKCVSCHITQGHGARLVNEIIKNKL